MPFYNYKCDNPDSPYHFKPKEIFFKSIKEYEEQGDKQVCEVTGSKLKVQIGRVSFKYSGKGFYSSKNYG